MDPYQGPDSWMRLCAICVLSCTDTNDIIDFVGTKLVIAFTSHNSVWTMAAKGLACWAPVSPRKKKE